ncbi:hypothetical protein [Sphingomonas sp. SRS2]|uniref:hypothetical protein n=1 Tax=Sphingomonas sp. SRS2 TaxID=133190 RepID=UPI0006991325|nr:hypothetical protein [Sphingomonas sp. SRS2]
MQRTRSANALLANVRNVADKAAAAWAEEALIAEQREHRQARTRDVAANLLDEKRRLRSLGDLAFNENPDRGQAAW